MTSLPRNIGLIYFRTSTHKQFKKISPELQRQECLVLARHDGREVVEGRDIYWDDESAFVGKGFKRAGFQRLTDRWKSDPRVASIYIYDLSRLFRDARAYFNYKFELDNSSVELVSVIEPLVRDNSPAGKLPVGIIALVNQYNSEVYGNKIREAMRFKAEAGVFPGKAPFGYRNAREEGEGKRRAWIEVNESEAPWVRKAFVTYAEGNHTLRSLADELARDGFPTKSGRPLSLSALESILKDPLYIGRIEWGGVSNPSAKHEQIIDLATFDQVQSILAAHNHGANRKRKHTFLLRGLAWCGECGSRIQAGYSRSKSGKYYGLYACQKRSKGKAVACHQRSTPLDTLELRFEDLFQLCELSAECVVAVEAEIEEKLGRKQRAAEATRRTLERSLADLRGAKTKAFLKHTLGEVEPSVYYEAKDALEKQEAKLREGLSRVGVDLSLMIRTVQIAKELARDISTTYSRATPAVRPLLAQAFFERLEVLDGQIAKASLTAPVEYILRHNLPTKPVFELGGLGGATRSLLEHPMWLWEPGNARVTGLLEKAYQALRGDHGLRAA